MDAAFVCPRVGCTEVVGYCCCLGPPPHWHWRFFSSITEEDTHVWLVGHLGAIIKLCQIFPPLFRFQILPNSLPGKLLWCSASRWVKGQELGRGFGERVVGGVWECLLLLLQLETAPETWARRCWSYICSRESYCYNLEDEESNGKKKTLMWTSRKSWSKGPDYLATSNHIPFLRLSRCLILKVVQMIQEKMQKNS